MSNCLRVLSLLLAAAGGLTAAPTIAADGTLARDASALPVTGAEDWSLRPTKVSPAAVPASSRPPKTIPLSNLPDERRSVRVVYQGYLEAGPLRPSR